MDMNKITPTLYQFVLLSYVNELEIFHITFITNTPRFFQYINHFHISFRGAITKDGD